MKPTIIYNCNNFSTGKPSRFLEVCLKKLAGNAARTGCELITITETPVKYGFNYVRDSYPRHEKGWCVDYYKSILWVLENTEKDDAPIFLVDDDCIYPDEHFLLPVPAGKICYNLELIYLGRGGYFDLHNRAAINCCCIHGSAGEIKRAYKLKLDEMEKGDFTCYEPAMGGPRDYRTTTTRTKVPVIDVRIHNNTWTLGSEKGANSFSGLPDAKYLLKELGE